VETRPTDQPSKKKSEATPIRLIPIARRTRDAARAFRRGDGYSAETRQTVKQLVRGVPVPAAAVRAARHETRGDVASWLGTLLSEHKRLDNPKYTLNVATTPLTTARSYAEQQFAAAGKSLDQELPEFDRNYRALQRAAAAAPDIPRIEMPVIEPTDFPTFESALRTGDLDLFQPFTRGRFVSVGRKWRAMQPKAGKEWIELGVKDGHVTDDIVPAEVTRIPADELLPTQGQIWLEKLIGSIIEWGKPTARSRILDATIIVSEEGYILDGHHRYGQVMLAAPHLRLKALYVPLSIDFLLEVGRGYGAALGNEPKP